MMVFHLEAIEKTYSTPHLKR